MNNLFVISGPSGSGKSTLIHRLLQENPELRFSVSHTTRPQRPGEIDGRDYHFVSDDSFRLMIAEERFAEWAVVHGHRYGTSWSEIEKKSTGDQILVLDIDVQGAGNIKQTFPEAMMVFVVPPSFRVLSERLWQREHRLSKEFEKRLQTARRELQEYHIYDFLVVNEALEEACASLKCLLAAFRLTMALNQEIIGRLLGEEA